MAPGTFVHVGSWASVMQDDSGSMPLVSYKISMMSGNHEVSGGLG